MDITSSRERGVSNKRAASPNEYGNYWSDTTANAAYSKLNEAEVAKQRRIVADAAVDKTKLSVQPPMKKTRGSSSVEQVVATKKPETKKPVKAATAVAVTKTKKPVRATASAAMTKMKKPLKVIAVPRSQKLTKMKDKVAFALARDKKSKSSSSSSSSVATSTSSAVVKTNKPWKKMTLAEKVSIAVQRAAASEEKQKEEKRLKQMNKLAKRQGQYTLNALFNTLKHILLHPLTHTYIPQYLQGLNSNILLHTFSNTHTLQYFQGLKRPEGEKRSRTPRPKEFAWKGTTHHRSNSSFAKICTHLWSS